MSGWMLTLKSPLDEDFDASALTEMLSAASASELANLMLSSSRPLRSVKVGDLFDITQLEECGRFILRGDFARLHRIASRWHSHALHIEGNVGNGLATQMKSGSIDLVGNAGHQVAAQMRGGRVHVTGNVGDRVGGPLPGKRSGMSGGSVIIQGSAGHAAGFRLRRGSIFVHGDCGEGAGMDMVAGTIFANGNTGMHLGAGMKRGTIVLGQPTTLDAERFTEPRAYHSSFASLLASDIERESSPLATALRSRFRRSLGDLSAGGQGEVWLLSANS
jgi:formylmethanofuran dehydrogenase subunit C